MSENIEKSSSIGKIKEEGTANSSANVNCHLQSPMETEKSGMAVTKIDTETKGTAEVDYTNNNTGQNRNYYPITRTRTRPRKRYRKSKHPKTDDNVNKEGYMTSKRRKTDDNLNTPINVVNPGLTESSSYGSESLNTDSIYYYDSSSEDGSEEYALTVSNLPKNWSFIQIKNYIDTECGPVDEMEMLKSDGAHGSIRLYFQTSSECKEAMVKLSEKKIEETRLSVEMEVFKDTEPSEKTEPIADMKPWNSAIDLWETDPLGMYGLKQQFLNSLGITPPIDRWVQVSNFRCDKSELRDVMELAGNVLMCTVITINGKYAKVMYSHPLEAVQAISMLNKQTFYGKTLKVVMDRCPSDTTILPKGLANIGLGLGKKGKPLRNIVKHYKRYVNKQSSQINPLMFTEIANQDNNIISKDKTETENVKQTDSAETSNDIESQIQTITFRVKNVEELNNCEIDSPEKDNTDTKKASTNQTKSVINNPHKTSLQSKPDENVSQNQSIIKDSSLNTKINRPNFMDSNDSIRPPGTSASLNDSGPVINPGFINGLLTTKTFNLPQNTVPQNLPRPFVSGPGPFSPNLGSRPFLPAAPGNPGSMGPRPPIGTMGSRQPIRPMGPRPAIGLMGPRPPMNPMGPRPLIGPMGPRPQVGPGPSFGPRPVIRPQGMEPGSVQLSNLPLSTTFNVLAEKLNQCGQVISLQFTTTGCAIATFARRAQAERCYTQTNLIGFTLRDVFLK